MNATTKQSEAAPSFNATRIPESEVATDAFGALIDAGYIRPEHYASLCYRYHNYMANNLPDVMLQLEPKQELEAVGDALITAINCAQTNDEDFPYAEILRRF